jgi:hypothetical protein|tara:strand:- start:38 stop:400 length:363 start_codon:yes stop_codon:yes gene_type:complete
MKPTQEQILSALNKLVRENKTELKAEKIELGLVDDIDKAYDKALGLEKNVSKTKDKLRSEVLKVADAWEKVEILSMKGIKAAKELGSKEAEKLFGSRGSDAKVNQKEMDSILSKITSFNI